MAARISPFAARGEQDALLARSAEVSVEQEPLEMMELRGLDWLRRGEHAQARSILLEALRRAKTMPTVMRERPRRSLGRVGLTLAA